MLNKSLLEYLSVDSQTNKMQNSMYGFVLMRRFNKVTIDRCQYAEKKWAKAIGTSTLRSDYMYKFLYCNIIPPFILHNGSVQKKYNTFTFQLW